MEAFQCFMLTFFILPIMVFVGWNNYTVHQKAARWHELYRGLETRNGWEVLNHNRTRHFAYKVDYEGLNFEVSWLKHGVRYYLQVRHQLANSEKLAVDVQYNFGILDRIIGPDEQLGDASFDAAVEIEGDEVQVTALMTNRARAALQEAVADGVTIKEGCLELFEESAFNVDDEVDDLLARIARPAIVLSSGGESQCSRLLFNLRNEEQVGVRARNLGMLLLHFPDDPQTQSALSDELRRSDLPSARGESLALEQEQGLIDALGGPEDTAIAAIYTLGSCGTLPSLVALRSYAIQPEKDYRWRLAQQSISAIQERLGPIDSGGLSLSEAPVGALSEAKVRGGAVTVAETSNTSE